MIIQAAGKTFPTNRVNKSTIMAGKTVLYRVAALAALLFGGACAAAPDTPDDPYEASNRQFFAMNQRMDRNLLRPVAEGYVAVVPAGGRAALHNLLAETHQPVVFANDLLQARPKAAGQALVRFTVNAILGFGGLADPASHLGIAEPSADFGQTLAVWGWRDAPYLMLPLIGPSNPRDALGTLGDIALDPSLYLQYKNYVWWMAGRKALTILDVRANNLEMLDDIERSSIDYYSATRSLYRQHRAAETGVNLENAP
jgi:phospholipid-binding lipoprotein MlaA